MTDLFRLPTPGVETRWASPENPRGERGAGGRANNGRKGRAWLTLAAGETVTLAESPGAPGTVRRIWATLDDRSPAMLRGLRLDCFWDGADTPAVSAPFGDFFGVGLGRTATFHSALFSNPEGRSFVCQVPMPFRTGMRLTVTNESGRDLAFLFYDVAYTLGDDHGPEDTGYLHAHWRRENPTTLQRDYELLPLVTGRGRFLGVNVGVRADVARYGPTWWGEGEAKFFLDGDADLPTLCGTGTEDYIGTAWGQGAFAHPHQGCPVADEEKSEYCFYRWHVPDPVYFSRSLRVTMQQIGHAFGDRLRNLLASGETVYRAGGPGLVPAHDELPTSGLLFERADDWSSCAYLYLDRPEAALPPLAPVEERVAGL